MKSLRSCVAHILTIAAAAAASLFSSPRAVAQNGVLYTIEPSDELAKYQSGARSVACEWLDNLYDIEIDPSETTAYVIKGLDIMAVDLATGRVTPLKRALELPAVSNSGAFFDLALEVRPGNQAPRFLYALAQTGQGATVFKLDIGSGEIIGERVIGLPFNFYRLTLTSESAAYVGCQAAIARLDLNVDTPAIQLTTCGPSSFWERAMGGLGPTQWYEAGNLHVTADESTAYFSTGWGGNYIGEVFLPEFSYCSVDLATGVPRVVAVSEYNSEFGMQPPVTFAVSRDDRTMLAISGWELVSIDLMTEGNPRTVLASPLSQFDGRLMTGFAQSITMTSGGAYFLSWFSLWRFDFASGECTSVRGSLRPRQMEVRGNTAYVCSPEFSSVDAVDLTTGQITNLVPAIGSFSPSIYYGLSAIDVNAAGTKMIAIGGAVDPWTGVQSDGYLMEIDLTTTPPQATRVASSNVQPWMIAELRYSPDGLSAYVSGDYPWFSLWKFDLRSGLETNLALNYGMMSYGEFVLTGDGTQAYTANGSLAAISLESGAVTTLFPSVGSFDGRLLQLSGDEQSVIGMSGAYGDLVALDVHTGAVSTLVSPITGYVLDFVYLNTADGQNVTATGAGVTLTFDTITTPGTTSVLPAPTGYAPPPGFMAGAGSVIYEVSTTATFSGPIDLCMPYNGAAFSDESSVRLFHYENGGWVDVTTSLDMQADIVCGRVTSLSPFAVFERDTLSLDSDGDGLSDSAEVNSYHTDPNNPDSDADDLDDGAEVARGTDPLLPDSDQDGLNDGAEVALATFGECPSPRVADSDNDGLSDWLEVTLHINPCDTDSDNDGLADGMEDDYGTDPFVADTDGDGLPDGTEVDVAQGSGCPNPMAADSDGDTLLDGAEVAAGTNPCAVDTDGDTVNDDTDPTPTVPGVTTGFLEDICRNLAEQIREAPLTLFEGPNTNARRARRTELAQLAMEAAKSILRRTEHEREREREHGQCERDEHEHRETREAAKKLGTLLDRIDGDRRPSDWMVDSPEKTGLANLTRWIINLVEM